MLQIVSVTALTGLLTVLVHQKIKILHHSECVDNAIT